MFIALLGINQIGKSTQIEMLKKHYADLNIRAMFLKYPLYDFPPTGPRILAAFKQGNPETLSPSEIQKLCAQNRRDFEPELRKLISGNDIVLAENYTGSGLAFGMSDGLEREFLEGINRDLLEPDLSILLDGERFMEAKEAGHYFEENPEKEERARAMHLVLARELGWHILKANRPVEEVNEDIFRLIHLKNEMHA